jgi:hypothetical protein
MQWSLNTVNAGYRHSLIGLTALLLGMGSGAVQAQSPDLIENNLLAELIQVDLYLGRQMPDGDTVSDEDFETFIDTEVTPRFPEGLTVWAANGRYQDVSGTVITEPSNVLRLVFLDTQANETALMEVIQAYITQFDQESVMVLVDEDVTVEFVPAIEAAPVPAIFTE